MIYLPEETLKLYNKSLNDFENLLLEFQEGCEKVKEDFLSKNFSNLNSDPEIDDYHSFLLQFIPYLNHLIFFGNDSEVIAKLKKYGFGNNTLMWMVNIEDIEYEIRRLEQIKGLLIFPNEYLSLCINHLKVKFQIEVFESFIGNIRHNGYETNKLYKDSINRSRRRANLDSEKAKPSKNMFEYLMNENIDYLEHISIEYGLNKSEVFLSTLKLLKGNTSLMISSLLFEVDGISKRRVYYELFPLLKMILKDKKLKSEIDFYENEEDTIYNNNYKLYRISKVRDVFNLK